MNKKQLIVLIISLLIIGCDKPNKDNPTAYKQLCKNGFLYESIAGLPYSAMYEKSKFQIIQITCIEPKEGF